MQAGTKNTWDHVLRRLEAKVSRHSYSTWFKPTRFQSEDVSSIQVRVPNSWFADWLKTHYLPQIQDALHEIKRTGLTVEFVPETIEIPTARTAEPTPASAASGARRGPARAHDAGPTPHASSVGKLNPRYTFGNFVVSSCNQFAHAAALAVAEQPSRAYNPLYFYGGVGLGKTHLIQAIGNRVVQDGRRLHYISSETFMNELIQAIRFEKTHEFKDRYRNVDVLLIDDIEFLAGKERTQEEFFHTFNALYDAEKQIVITSDVPPREIPTLEERLRSRFEWGLLADIQPPDLETKIAILGKKSETFGIELPDEVSLFIASTCSSNVRELEGALNKVIAYSSMSGREITLDLAKEQLRDFLPAESPATTVESIQKLVANYFELKVSDLKSKNNSRNISQPRQIAMYLCKKLTPCSLPDIGRRFGGKHHSTVIHALQRVEQRRIDEGDFDRLVDHFMLSLK